MATGGRLRLDIAVPLLGAALLVFGAGIAVGAYQLPPYRQIAAAVDAFRDWRRNWRHYAGLRSKYLRRSPRTEGGVTIRDSERAFEGYTFVSAFTGERFEALLLDMEGAIVHRWRVSPRAVWPDAERPEPVPADWDFNIHGALMTPEGDALLSTGGAGVVRLDRCSRPVWASEVGTHHDVDLLPDGRVFSLSAHLVRETRPDRPLLFPGPTGFYNDHTIVELDDRGRLVREISVIDSIYRSGRPELLFAGPGTEMQSRSEDPLHLNTVEILRPEMADAFPLFEAGDILTSARSIHTIFVLDGETGLIKWKMTGPFVGQHDPDFLPNGHILLYDNRQATATRPLFGPTRILEIDPLSREIVWKWEGDENTRFYNDGRGEQAPLPNGNILISDVDGGRVFEIERETGEIVWEWVNLLEPGWVGMVIDAERYPAEQVRFLDQPCPGEERPVAEDAERGDTGPARRG